MSRDKDDLDDFNRPLTRKERNYIKKMQRKDHLNKIRQNAREENYTKSERDRMNAQHNMINKVAIKSDIANQVGKDLQKGK